MANKVAELYATFRVNFEKATLDVANTALGELRIGTLAEIASLAGLTRMLFDVGNNAVKTATHLHMLGTVYGLNTTQLQNMERAGLAANVSTDKMDASILGLQNNLAALNLGRVSDAFLQAAGFFGVRVGPGTSQDDLMNQLMKKVPQFIKAHGSMGKSMAGLLLQDMQVDPEMIQYFLGGKKSKPGVDVAGKTIEALTATSEAMNMAAFDIRNLGTNSISPLVEILGPISDYLKTIADAAGGVDNLAHPFRTAEGLWERAKGAVHSLGYMTPEQAKLAATHQLSLHTGGSSPYVSASLHPATVAAMLMAGEKTSGDINSETTVHIHGSADSQTVRRMTSALKDRDAKRATDNAGAAAIYNPLEAGQGQ
jgi:hypothetical protein